ncbi:LolA family protein [Dinghuibacter silviterrae]|uniref:Outer membrane lipoprotein-sorting protein n=1 Tax=Dinghuibacter silviterrae TaxID=1539049 RepID=A0A4R8DW29_9BACT|nr:outer membrane lipoprotein carrier protein LolA [Dinghuibacter silviterrae]TDX02276.1 outer membrane lipoprotein-sorting protein [Dinghuibacter silviterrae]
MRKMIMLLCITATQSVRAQYPGYSLVADNGPFKTRFAEASQKNTSLKADFVQEKNLSVLSEKIVSKGKFCFRRPDNVRMEYTQPFQYLMILANSHVYIRDGQKENSVSAKSNKLFGQINQLVVDCVRGTELSNPDFKVRVFEGEQTYLVELTPVSKNLKDLFQTVSVVLDKKDFTANRIRMLEPSGDNTVITFSNKELNVPISDAQFSLH